MVTEQWTETFERWRSYVAEGLQSYFEDASPAADFLQASDLGPLPFTPFERLQPMSARGEKAAEGALNVLRSLDDRVEFATVGGGQFAATGTVRKRLRKLLREPNISARIIKLGEVAGALVVIAGVATGVWYWLMPKTEPASAHVSIRSIASRRYGDWLRKEHISTKGFSKDELRARGIEVTYRLTTSGFGRKTEIPVAVLLSNLDGKTLNTIEDPFTLDREGDGCDGCSDWLPLGQQQTTVFVTIDVFRAGVDEDPIASDQASYCPQSPSLKSCD